VHSEVLGLTTLCIYSAIYKPCHSTDLCRAVSRYLLVN